MHNVPTPIALANSISCRSHNPPMRYRWMGSNYFGFSRCANRQVLAISVNTVIAYASIPKSDYTVGGGNTAKLSLC